MRQWNDNKQQCGCPSKERSKCQNELPLALCAEAEAVIWLVSEVGSGPAAITWLSSGWGGVTMHCPAVELTPDSTSLRLAQFKLCSDTLKKVTLGSRATPTSFKVC